MDDKERDKLMKEIAKEQQYGFKLKRVNEGLIDTIKTALETSSIWSYLPDVAQMLSEALIKAKSKQ